MPFKRNDEMRPFQSPENAMEDAIAEFAQTKASLERTHDRIAQLEHAHRDSERTIIRLSDKIEMQDSEIRRLTLERNVYMKHSTELAVQIEAIAQATEGGASMVRKMVQTAKETAVTNALGQQMPSQPAPPRPMPILASDDGADGAVEMGRRFGSGFLSDAPATTSGTAILKTLGR